MNQLKLLLAPALAAATLLVASSRSDAALMVYEGFKGYNSAVQLKDQLPSANTIGLNQSTAWISSNATEQTLLVSGLDFGSGNTQLHTTGGAIQRQNSVSSSVSAKLNIDNSNFTNGQFVGTMYASYLVQTTGTGTGINGNAHVVVFNGLNTNTRRFRAGAATGANDAINSPVGVDYVGNSFIEGSGNTNVNGETFMILSRFTRVGQALSSTTPGVGTVWALTSDQFDYFKTNDWAGIDTATVGLGITNVRGKAVDTHSTAIAANATAKNILDNNLWWTIGSGSTAALNNVKFDELRMGTSFDDVTPVVPEPSSVALVVLGLAGVSVDRRATKKK